MKKRFLTALLTIFALVVLTPAAFAAVDVGGTEYLWSLHLWNTDITRDHCVYLSDDGGASYVALGGLPDYVLQVALTGLPDGGLRVEGRDQWEDTYTWSRDYTAAEVKAAFAGERNVTPIEAKASNGTVTLGERYVEDSVNGDPALPGYDGWDKSSEKSGPQFIYTTDGVSWQAVEEPPEGIYDIWWDGERFCSSYNHWDTESNQYQPWLYTSADGLHWTLEKNTPKKRTAPLWTCELGKYHFEVVESAAEEDGQYRTHLDVYLMDKDHVDRGVRLPHFREAFEARGISPGYIQAWPTPDDTVTVAVYDIYARERFMVEICYPVSSLDWCLENLSETFRTPQVAVQGNGVSLAAVEGWRSNVSGYLLLRNGGSGWQRVENVDFGTYFQLMPFNGRTFLLGAAGTIYASEDGLNWESLSGTDLDVGESKYTLRKRYALQWTGDKYITCRQVFERLVGRGGSWGKWYDPRCTEVRFLDENFNLLSSYDFGRQVSGVGFRDGVYYAKVWDRSEVAFEDVGDELDQAATLYRSTDGKTWTAMPKIYTQLDEVMLSEAGDWNRAMKNGPICSMAQLDRWRFVLSADERIYLMGDNAGEWVELPDLHNAVEAAGFAPGELTAAYKPDGTVDVTVWGDRGYNRKDTSSHISIAYPTDSLDWCKENLVEARFMRVTPNWEDVCVLPNGTEVTTFPLANGERELVYRNESTGGEYQYYENAPWSGNIKLLPFSGKALMLYSNSALYLTEDGVNWRKADSEWLRERIGWNIFPYSFVWTGEKYLVGFQPFGGWGKGTSYLVEDMGKCFFLDENLNDLSEHDFTEYDPGGVGWKRRNVEKVGYVDGTYYAQLSGAIQGCRNDGVWYTEDGEPVLYCSMDGVNWEQTDIFQVRECLMPLQSN